MDGEKSLHAIRSLSNFLLDDEDAVSSELVQKTLALALIQSLKSNITLHKDLDELKNRFLEYEKKVDFIDRDLMDTQQYIRRWSIEIKGIPETIAQNDLKSYVVHQILERSCGYQFHDSYIEAVHRLKKRNMNEPAHVVVRLNNRRDAENTIRGRWKLRSYGHLRNIFVMDNLCPRYRDIFDDLTDLKESGLVKQVWSYNGKVHYKTTHNRRAKGKRVWHMDDLKPLKESTLTLNFERQARNEYDQQLPSLMNINVAPPPNRPRPPSPPTPTPPPPLAEAAEAAEPTVATIVNNITDVSDLSVAEDIPDLESSRDAESGTLAFTISPVSLPSGDNEVSEISSHVPAVSNAAVESSSAVVESDSPVNEFAESSSYQISAAVALSSHPPGPEIAEMVSSVTHVTENSSPSPNAAVKSPPTVIECDSGSPPKENITEHDSDDLDVENDMVRQDDGGEPAIDSEPEESPIEVPLQSLVATLPTDAETDTNARDSCTSVSTEISPPSSNAVIKTPPHPSPTPETVEIPSYVPAVSTDSQDATHVDESSSNVTVEKPIESSSPPSKITVETSLHQSPTPESVEIPSYVPAVSTDSQDATHVEESLSNGTVDKATEISSPSSAVVESDPLDNLNSVVVYNSPNSTSNNVINPVDSATVPPLNTGTPLKESTTGHNSSLGAALPTDAVTIDTIAKDLSTSVSRNPIVSSETASDSVPNNNADPIIWSDEDVFDELGEPTPAISLTAPTPITEDDQAHDHFYSCSSSIGGLQLKLKRRTVSMLNEFCRSLDSSSPKTPSSKAQFDPSLSESQLSHAGFFNHNDSVPDISVKLSRCNSYASLLTENDDSG